MFLNLLANEIDPSLYDKNISVGEAAIDALLGFITVFVGIALLVLIVWAVGKAMQSVESKSKNGGEKKPKVKKRTAGGKTDERARKERARRSDDFRIQRNRRRNDSRDFRSDRRILCGRKPYLRICGETY